MERTAAADVGGRWEREPELAELDLARVSTEQGRRAMAVLRQVVAVARDENRGMPPLSARQAAGIEDPLPGA